MLRSCLVAAALGGLLAAAGGGKRDVDVLRGTRLILVHGGRSTRVGPHGLDLRAAGGASVRVTSLTNAISIHRYRRPGGWQFVELSVTPSIWLRHPRLLLSHDAPHPGPAVPRTTLWVGADPDPERGRGPGITLVTTEGCGRALDGERRGFRFP